MHLKDETLRAFLDGQLAATEKKPTADHLAACLKCTRRLEILTRAAQFTAFQIEKLAPGENELNASPHAALNRFRFQKEKTMAKFFRRPVWVMGAVALILGFSLFFAPVRALASSFLGLFRVQQIQVVSFDPAALERYDTSDNDQILQAFFQDNLTTTEQGPYTEVSDPNEAAALAGFTPRLPQDSETASLGIQPGETVEINIDSESMNAGLDAFGFSDVKISSDFDGQKIVVTIPPAVTTAFGECPENPQDSSIENLAACMVLIQLPAPTVSAPESFPVVQLGEVMLQMLGMSPEQASQFSQSIDWSSTLILPIPIDPNIITSDITVDGVAGTLIRNPENSQYTIVWAKNGFLYGFNGFTEITPALRLADTLQ